MAFSKIFIASSLLEIPPAVLVCCELACNKLSIHKTQKPAKVFVLNHCFCLNDPDSTVPERLYFLFKVLDWVREMTYMFEYLNTFECKV